MSEKDGEELPKRIQLSRKKGWRMPENTVKVTRGKGAAGRWGNPYRAIETSLDQWQVVRSDGFTFPQKYASLREATCAAVDQFRVFMSFGDRRAWAEQQLRGKNLACWCKLPEPGQPDLCHARTLLELANPRAGRK